MMAILLVGIFLQCSSSEVSGNSLEKQESISAKDNAVDFQPKLLAKDSLATYAQVGPWKSHGDILYGVSESLYGNMPDLRFKDNGTVINHIWSADNNPSNTNSISIMTESEYKSGRVSLNSSYAYAAFLDVNNIIEKDNQLIVPAAKKLSGERYSKLLGPNGPLSLTMTLTAVPRVSQIEHKYTISNNSTSAQKFYAVKVVDTELANNDKVPVFSRGKGKGIYIETPKPGIGNETYRLDYVTNVTNGPGLYSGSNPPNKAFTSVFGNDPNSPNAPDVQADEGQVLGTGTQDSAIYMSWGMVTLLPGSSIDLNYNVSINSTASLETKKSYKNLTSSDKKNHVNDKIEYKVDVINTSKVEDMQSVSIKEVLPKGTTSPTSIKVNQLGEVKEYDPKDVYDPVEHTIKIDGLSLNLDDSLSLSYETSLTADSKKKNLVNTSEVTGIATSGFEVEKNVAVDLYVEDISDGKLTVKYLDSSNKEISKQKVTIAEIGSAYDESPISINDYTHFKTIGETKGLIEEQEKEITFIYLKNDEAIQLKQKVNDDSGTSLDDGNIKQGKVLSYELEFSLNDLLSSEGYSYNTLTLSEILDEGLEIPTDLAFQNSQGTTVGSVTYDETSNKINADLTSLDISAKEKLILKYNAKVNSNTKVGTVIEEQGEAVTVRLKNDRADISIPSKSSNLVSTTVIAGLLEFVSAPDEVSFGKDIKLSSKTTTHKVKELQGQQLVVQDFRGEGNQWQMSVEILEDLTSEDSEDKLLESLYYMTDDKEIIINSESQVIKKQTTSTDTPVNLSNDWSESKGLALKLKPGIAKAKQYKGSIQWSLRDVPGA